MLGLPVSSPTADATPPPAELPPLPGAWRLDRPAAAPQPHLAEEVEFVPLTAAIEPMAALGLPVRRDGGPDPLWGPDPLARYHGKPAGDARLFAPPTADTGVPPSTLRGADTPALPPGFRSAFADMPAAAARVESVPAPAPSAPAVPGALWPVFALNWILETVLGLFGPPGAAVRHPAAKHLLGACGVLLLAAAGVWSARGMGWVALPFPR
jgi:hypothetical protein